MVLFLNDRIKQNIPRSGFVQVLQGSPLGITEGNPGDYLNAPELWILKRFQRKLAL
jgi:hypothetical protein